MVTRCTWVVVVAVAVVVSGCVADAPEEGTAEPAPPVQATEPAATSTPTPAPTPPAPEANVGERTTADDLAAWDDLTTGEVVLVGPDGEEVELAVYAAVIPDQRRTGLMERDDLPPDAGMIFRFPQERSGGFWMFNTLLPLSIGFFADDGELLAVLDMEPCASDTSRDCPVYDPDVSYTDAIEVHQGWFDEVGVEAGWGLVGAEHLPDGS